MNKVYFYLFYIPIGIILVFSIGPYLKNRKYQQDKVFWDNWLNEHKVKTQLTYTCNFCEKTENFEQVNFRLPKSVKKTFFSFSQSSDDNLFISVRCKICQSEIGRKKT